jgi:hypothetical protein
MQEYITNFSLQIFPTLDFVSLILPNLRTPLWGFWHPLCQLFYNIDLRCCNKKFPLFKCILIFICHSVLQLEPCFFHHPSTSTPQIYFYFELHYYSVKSLVQRISSMISPVVWTRKKYTRINLPPCPPFSLLSYLPLSIT